MALIACPECGKEISEKVTACPHCGYTFVDESTHKFEEAGVIEEEVEKASEGKIISKFTSFKKPSKKQIIIATVFVICLFIVALSTAYLTNPINKFKSEVENNNSSAAAIIYNDKIISNTKYLKEANAFLDKTSQTVLNDYINDKIEFKDAAKVMETIVGVGASIPGLNNTKGLFDNNHNSKVAYENAEALIKAKDIAGALMEYDKVISSDKNYDNAQNKMKENKDIYQKIIFEEVDKLVLANKYSEAKSALYDVKGIINSAVIDSKTIAVEKSYEQYLINSQALSVVTVGFFHDILDEKFVSVTLKNNTDKVVKNYNVGLLGYDIAGYPVKIGWLFEGFYQEGNAEKNIQPWGTAGGDYGWQLGGPDEGGNIAKVISCVISVEYYDGTSWSNEYFPIWKEKYFQKPLN